MNTRIRKFLSFSNLIACLALFIALGGTVYAAGKISGRQIKVRSLPGNRIKPRTITANRIKKKTLTGRQIKNHSLTGDEINQGTLTGISAASLADVHYESVTVFLPIGHPSAMATANCPDGSYAIGGGATVSHKDEATVNDSGPSPLRTGWTATGFARSSSGTQMTVTAICVPVEKPGGKTTNMPDNTPQYHPVG